MSIGNENVHTNSEFTSIRTSDNYMNNERVKLPQSHISIDFYRWPNGRMASQLAVSMHLEMYVC